MRMRMKGLIVNRIGIRSLVALLTRSNPFGATLELNAFSPALNSLLLVI